jgi:bacillopeptidase F (M6 metalloprotease family)
MIVAFIEAERHPATSWEHAKRMFLAAVEADQAVEVWDTDELTNTGVVLWRFDGAARQASMRHEIPADDATLSTDA